MKWCYHPAPIIKSSLSGLVCLLLFLLLMFACQENENKHSKFVQAKDSTTHLVQPGSEDTTARRPAFPGGDNIQQNCNFVQSQAELLLEEYYRKGTTTERQQTIVAKLEKLNQEWKQMECQQVFGFMIPQIPPSPKGKN